MNQIVPLGQAALPAAFQNMSHVPDMNAAAQANLAASFAIIGYRGKNWRLKYRGEEQVVMDGRGVPDPILNVVIVGISPSISKQYYDKKYTEGDDAAPDCFSVNGVTPDQASPKKQCEACAVCPMNAWGSKITEAGKKAKACQDSRRVAVVPAEDIENIDFGGPVMLRVPPMSLANLSAYSQKLARFNAQPFMVVTQMSFDHDVAYPQITFKEVGWVSAEDAPSVLKMIEDPQIDRMLSTEVAEATHDPQGEPASALTGGPPAAFTQVQQAADASVAPPVPAPTPAPAPAPTPMVQVAKEAVAAKKGAFGAKPVAQPAATAKAGFGAPKAQPQPQVQQPVQETAQTAPAAPVEEPAAETPAQLQPAPNDMEAAIDNLLGL